MALLAWVVCLVLLAPSTVHPAPTYDLEVLDREEGWVVTGEHVEEELLVDHVEEELVEGELGEDEPEPEDEDTYDYGDVDWEETSMESPKFIKNFREKAAAVMAAVGNSSAARDGRMGAATRALALGSPDLEELVGSERGRHLLLITLLEDSGTPAWGARCYGRLLLFLPASLRAPEQPLEVPRGALLLGEVVEKGRLVTREQVVARFNALVPPELHRLAGNQSEVATFSFYNRRHRAAVRVLVDGLVELDFPTALSLLATIHGLAAPDLLLEVLTLVVLGRKDCGLTMPDRVYLRPELFFSLEEQEGEEEEEEGGAEVHHHRYKRQTVDNVDWTNRRNPYNRPGSDPRYYREDPR